MIIVQSFERAAEHGRLDPASGEVELLPDSVSVNRISGKYFAHGGSTISLYLLQGRLWLQLDEKRVQVDSDVRADLERFGNGLRLLVFRSDTLAFGFSYPLPDPGIPADLLWLTMMERDHIDVGFWMKDILEKPERQQVALEVWEDASAD